MPHITLVYKLKRDGQLCRGCAEVLELLRRDGVEDRIDRMLVADERDPDGEAWELARRYFVRTAPFFLVEQEGVPRIYTSYLRLYRDVLHPEREGGPLSAIHDEAVYDVI